MTWERNPYPPQDVLDVLATKIQAALDARRPAESIFALIEERAMPMRTAAANGDRDSQLFLGRLDLLRGQLHASKSKATLLSAVEVARRMPGGKGLKPDGKTPQDSVYRVLRKIGTLHNGKWYVAEDRLDAHLKGETA